MNKPHVAVSELLAKGVADGVYKPALLEGCSSQIPTDRNPHVVKFMEFILFSKPDPSDVSQPQYLSDRASEPEYLILQPYKLFLDAASQNSVPADLQTNVVKPMATKLVQHMTAASHARATTAKEQEMKDKALEAADQAGFGYQSQGDKESDEDFFGRVLAGVFLPQDYRPFSDPHPHFALRVMYEQSWMPIGYTRGELINTLNLAPGEQLTLEFHSWDKSTTKSEEELAQESELRTSEKMTQRDALTVHQEVARETGASLHANLTIPIEGVPVKLDANASNKVNTTNKQTVESTQEHTVEASNTLKNSRKIRVEIAREVGREDKQTRVITNKNMCHTLNFEYFEIMANYLVATRRVAVEPCLLLPNPNAPYTSHWVLCFEDVLKRVLIDKTFLPGFEAAHLLEANDRLRELRKADTKTALVAGGDHLGDAKTKITDAYKHLSQDLNAVRGDATGCAWALVGGLIGWAVCLAATSGVQALQETLYMSFLEMNKTAIHALETLKVDTASSDDAMQTFFAAVKPRDFQYTPLPASIERGFDALGLPAGLGDALLGWGLLDLLADDAGLSNAVQAAREKLDRLLQPLPPVPPPTDNAQAATSDRASMIDVAQAEVNFDQLKCHIENNWAHYLQAIWLSEHPNQRFVRLQSYGSVAAIIRNELLGFYGHKAAYPIVDLDATSALVDANGKQLINLTSIISAIRTDIQAEKPTPQLVSLPTPGAVLEAAIGECDACEDFIQKTRALDLRTQEAKAREEEAEAARFEARQAKAQPDLDDPLAARNQGAIRIVLKEEK
jgi:hypothetical protein